LLRTNLHGRSRTVPAQSSRQRRFAPTAVHLGSGMPFGFPLESAFTFTGIPTKWTLIRSVHSEEWLSAIRMSRRSQPDAYLNYGG
jgi:hypothetical protein